MGVYDQTMKMRFLVGLCVLAPLLWGMEAFGQTPLPANVRIDVRTVVVETSSSRALGVEGQGGAVMHNDDVYAQFTFKPRVHYRKVEERGDVTQFLVTSSGQTASLRVGETVPAWTWIRDYAWRQGYIREIELHWQEVGAFLLVTPTVEADGQTVQVRITPELRGRNPDGEAQSITFAGVTTQVRVRNGHTIALGGIARDESFYDRFLLGMDEFQRVEHLDIQLTPTILPVAP